MHNMYVHHELVGKHVLGLLFVPAYLQSYVDNALEDFIYSTTHISTFDAPHLKGSAWYRDCQPGFTPPGEEGLFSSLSKITLVEVVADEEEAMQPTPVEKPKRTRGEKAKDGTATELAAHSTAFVVTHSTMKATTKASASPISTAIGSLSIVLSMVLEVASQSDATVPSLQNMKVVAPYASITSFGTIPISASSRMQIWRTSSRSIRWLRSTTQSTFAYKNS